MALAFHVDRGAYGAVALDGLNAVVAIRTPGAMAEGMRWDNSGKNGHYAPISWSVN